MSAAVFMVNLDARAVIPLLPSVAEDFGTSVTSAGVIITAYMVPYGALQLVYGPLADRVGRLVIARVTLAAFAVGCAACGLADSLLTLGLLRVVTGGTAAALFPMALAYVGDTFAYRERPAAISVLVSASAGAQLISLALGGILAGFVSWRALFFLTGGLSLGVILALLWLPARAAGGEPAGALAGYRRVFATPAGWVIPGLAFTEGALFYGGLAYLGGFLREEWGLPYPTIGLLLAVYGVATLAASRCLTWVARRVTEPTRFAAGVLVTAVGYAIGAWVGPWEPIVVVMALLGVGFIGAHPVLQARATDIVPEARGTAIAVFACALFMGSAAGTAAAGWGIDLFGYRAVLALVAGGLVIFAWVGWVALRGLVSRP